MITWPVVIKFEGDNELSFIATQSEWEHDEDFNRAKYHSADQVIDSNGNTFHLNNSQDGVVTFTDTGEKIELSAMTELVREHASQLGNCCVSKLYFYTLSEAVATVGSLSLML